MDFEPDARSIPDAVCLRRHRNSQHRWNGASAAVVYAPNATADFKGNAAFYGSVIAAHLKDVEMGPSTTICT